MAAPFRYFERIDEAASRYEFWEIALDGATLLVRSGPVGTSGKLERESCASELTAQGEHARRIAARVADGFAEVADRRLDSRTRALEDAIAADLDDEAAFLVYADWIQTLGDPRGALIVAQAAAERDRGAAERASEYLAQHAGLFLGPLAGHAGYDGALLELRWQWGFLRRARIAGRDAWVGRPDAVLEQLLDHASARWLAELDIDLTFGVGNLLRVLAARQLPHLRALTIGEVGELVQSYEEYDEDGNYVDPPLERHYLGPLWRAVPRVRHLIVRGEPAAFGRIELPVCEHLELHTRGLPRLHAEQLERADLPELQRLDLRYRVRRPVAEELAPILGGSLLRRIAQLAITSTADDALCAALARVRSASLRELDLSSGDITDDGAELLAAGGLALDILDVTRNRLTHRGIDRLGAIAKLVIAEQQRSRS